MRADARWYAADGRRTPRCCASGTCGWTLRREVHRREVRIELAAKEFALLEALMRRPGEVLTRLELIEQAWDFAYETRSM
jgi:DNA-binding response OmpR family regulator